MSEEITVAQIQRAGPPGSMNSLRIALPDPLPRDAWPVIRDFWSAVGLYCSKADLAHSRLVVIGRVPYTIRVDDQELAFRPSPGVPATTIEGIMFFDWPTLLLVHQNLRIAAVLEELIHSFMHITDEDLARHLVTCLHQPVVYRNGQLRLRESRPGVP